MPVPSDISELSQTAGSNNPPGSESPITTDDYLRTYASFIATLRDGKGFSTEVDVASAATCDIGAANAMFLRVTGTTTITSFGANYNGPRFIRFGGALTLTHNASTLILPGGVSIVTAAGDTCIAVPIGASGWQVLFYQFANTLVTPVGECRLAKSGADLVLSRYNGSRITINGINQSIPAAGVSLAPTALAINTTFYIYAYMSGGTMTLEASTTASAVDATTGVRIKTGDATRTLVGMARTITGPAWADSNTQRFTISYFNRRSIKGVASYTADQSPNVSATVFTEASTSSRVEFLAWGDEDVNCWLNGSGYSSSGSPIYLRISVDGTAAVATNLIELQANDVGNLSCGGSAELSQGYHYTTAHSRTANATGTLVGTGDAPLTNYVVIRG